MVRRPIIGNGFDNVGEGYGDTFLIPYSEKFWTVHPREMTHDWTNNRIPPSSTRQMLSGAFIKAQTNVGTNAVFQVPREWGFRCYSGWAGF